MILLSSLIAVAAASTTALVDFDELPASVQRQLADAGHCRAEAVWVVDEQDATRARYRPVGTRDGGPSDLVALDTRLLPVDQGRLDPELRVASGVAVVARDLVAIVDGTYLDDELALARSTYWLRSTYVVDGAFIVDGAFLSDSVRRALHTGGPETVGISPVPVPGS